MTSRQYRTAMGKVVDMGALTLQNENIRSVGNMNVNARGDRLNSSNKIIDKKSQQVNRQYKKQVSATSIPATTSNAALRRDRALEEQALLAVESTDTINELPEETVEVAPASELQGGLAAAIAKAKTVQQTKLPTPKEAAKAAGVRKI